MNKFHTFTLIGLLAGCTVGPDYKMPDISLPDGWFSPHATKLATDKKALIEQTWWHNFNDPILDQLIEKAAGSNFDLKIAEARINEARAARATAENDFLPTVNAVASDEREANQLAFGQPFPGLQKPFSVYEAGFDASWEPDIFGGKRRALESSSAELAASESSRDGIRVSLLAEVARTYVDIRQYQQQLKLANETIDAEQHTVGIVGERYHAGKTSEFDLTQAKAQLSQEQTQLPYYENLLAQAEFSMDVLLEQQPGFTHKLVEERKPVPVSDKEMVLAAPADVIANRPDIRVAERQLASATAEQGVAVAQFFPDISLSGFVGVLNTESSHLLEASSKSWDVGGNILSPILNYGRLSANLHAADARQQQALASYQKSIIAALSDVAKSVTAYSKQEEYREALNKTVIDNRETTAIARMRYKEGVSSFIDVLDAERTLYASESKLAEANAQASQNLIAVYKSLGGGWKKS